MKHYTFLLPVVALITLSACTQELSDTDRALLTSTYSEAQEAKTRPRLQTRTQRELLRMPPILPLPLQPQMKKPTG